MRSTRGLLWLLGFLALAGCADPAPPPQAKDDTEPATIRKASCTRATGSIVIDGTADEAAWQAAPVLSDFAVFWGKRKPKTATKARLLWDDKYLYFNGEMEDHDLYADIKGHNNMPWLNDVFELFFKPATDKLTYYEFQVNANNAQLELFLPSRGAGGWQRFAPITKFGMVSAVRLQGTLNKWEDKDTGWSVEGRIPWTAFRASGGRPKPGDQWRFSLSRYDYSVTFDKPELSASAPLSQPDFHRYEDYGELTFVN